MDKSAGKRSCHWVDKFSLVTQDPVSISFCSHGSQAFGWDVTLTDEHLIGTAAGVICSRAVRRLQETTRWVPEALKSSARPAHEELVEAGALPRFIEAPTATTTRNPMSEKFVITPADAEQSTTRRHQEEIPRESQPASSSFCAATDTSMQIPDPQVPTLARHLSPAEREDSIRKRQRSEEVNTVLTIAGVYTGNEIATLTDDQKVLHTATLNELRNVEKFGVVEVVDRPQFQQVVSTRWVSTQRLTDPTK